MTTWSGEECNAIRGTESSIFPPFKDKTEGIWAFEEGICRSMQTVYEKPSQYSGLPTYRHIVNIGDINVIYKNLNYFLHILFDLYIVF